MNDRTRKNITQIADWIIKNFDIEIPITNMDEVVTKLGGRIEEVEEAIFSDTIKKGDVGDVAFVVQISKYTSNRIRNFAVAHEIGHLFMHMGYMSDYDAWNKMDDDANLIGTTHKEFEAHEFACAFLMPQKEYYDFVYENKENNGISTEKLGAYFGVPNGEAVNRGKWLGVLLWR